MVIKDRMGPVHSDWKGIRGGFWGARNGLFPDLQADNTSVQFVKIH